MSKKTLAALSEQPEIIRLFIPQVSSMGGRQYVPYALSAHAKSLKGRR